MLSDLDASAQAAIEQASSTKLHQCRIVTLPVSTLVLTAGLSANFGEVLTAASLPYRLLLAAASSCLQSLPALTDAKVQITAMHSLAWAKQVPWPGNHCECPATLDEIRLFSKAITEGQQAFMPNESILSMQFTLVTMSPDWGKSWVMKEVLGWRQHSPSPSNCKTFKEFLDVLTCRKEVVEPLIRCISQLANTDCFYLCLPLNQQAELDIQLHCLDCSGLLCQNYDYSLGLMMK